jgi:heme-degrading monooxygenase HmoA
LTLDQFYSYGSSVASCCGPSAANASLFIQTEETGMSFIAMNRFKIRPGREADFEQIWKSRESHLNELKGFREFRLLKGPASEDSCLYSSHVVWDSREDFEAWTKSEQFKASHRNAGKSEGESPIMGHPSFEGFETVIHEA